jgi:predicted RNase H-like HicB family nuclease
MSLSQPHTPPRAKLVEHKAWVAITPAEDVPGEWVARCLDLNVVTQGRSLSHALEMIVDAVNIGVEEDCNADLNPFDRSAPAEQWDEFWQNMRRAELTTLDDLTTLAEAGEMPWMATQLTIRLIAEEIPARSVQKVEQAAMAQHARSAA